ncbi:hypothetical protein [Nostoc sp. UHCC 0870]|uniref:hypothetical protein n=1 Tax=Nostoc sp. UHCC 0870 TaxID=2914041 RepID=UPI001EE0C787|nr:hypothetical protein [Nostoc sp. UHCC 0870]UKO97056.1 hypothetical protein L6494_21040 [Nostoc sp. UHCC 0870]
MSIQELEQQLLSLDLAERIRILQLLAQSLTVPSVSQRSPSPDELNLTRDGEPPAGGDRTPHHPLRSISMTIPPDFDEPMSELWDVLEK